MTKDDEYTNIILEEIRGSEQGSYRSGRADARETGHTG
jgi:hypothetical protein